MLIYLIRLVAFVFLSCINRTPFAIPHAQAPRIKPLSLLFVTSLHPTLLLWLLRVWLRCIWEPIHAIVVDSISRVRPARHDIFREMREIGSVCVAVKEEDMMWVNGAYRRDDAVIERYKTRMTRVCRLIHRIIASDPRIILVMLRKFLPQPDNTVLKVAVPPEVTQVNSRIAVPPSILAAGACVQVENRVDAVLRAGVHDAIEMLETGGLEYARVIVVLKMSVVYGDADTVQA